MSEFLTFLSKIIIESIKTSGIGMTILFLILILILILIFITGNSLIPFVLKKIFKKDFFQSSCKFDINAVKQIYQQLYDVINEYTNKMISSLSMHNYSKLLKILLGVNENYRECIKNSIYSFIDDKISLTQFFKLENCINHYLDTLLIDCIKEFIFNKERFLEEAKKEITPVSEDFISNLKISLAKQYDQVNLKIEIDILVDNYLKDLEEILTDIYRKIIINDANIKFIKL